MCNNDNDNGPKSFHGMAGPKPGDRRRGESAADFYRRQGRDGGFLAVAIRWVVRRPRPA